MDKLHQFYISNPWKELSYKSKIASGGKCARCGKMIADTSKLIGHHKIKLTEQNVNDPTIALNPANVEVICFDCHNKEHERFGYQKSKQVYIIHGSPLSGKTTLARELMEPGDIMLDLDLLYMAISGLPMDIKPNNIRFNVFRLRDNLLDQIKTRYGEWHSAYVIGGYPEKHERDRLALMIGAELVHCDANKAECVRRCLASGRPEQWLGYIEDYWQRFSE